MLHRIVVEHAVEVDQLPVGVLDVEFGRMADREVLVAGIVPFVARFVYELDAALGEAVAEPVDDGARFVAPELDEVLTHVTSRVLRRHGDEFELVDLRAPFLLVAAVDRAEVFAHARADGEAVDADHLAARFGSRRHGEHAARAATDDEDVRAVGRRDFAFGEFGFLAEPVAVVGLVRLLVDDFNRDFAAGLGDTLRRGLVHGARGDRGTRNGVDLGALRRHEGLLEGLGRRLTDRGRFVRNVEHDVGDAVGVERHRHDDVAADTLGGGGVDAGLVDARRSRPGADGREGRAAGDGVAQERATRESFGHDSYAFVKTGENRNQAEMTPHARRGENGNKGTTEGLTRVKYPLRDR